MAMRRMPLSPYYGRTLFETFEQMAILSEHKPKEVFVELRYCGANVQIGTKVYRHNLKRDSPSAGVATSDAAAPSGLPSGRRRSMEGCGETG